MQSCGLYDETNYIHTLVALLYVNSFKLSVLPTGTVFVSASCTLSNKNLTLLFMSGTHIEFEQARIALFVLESPMNCSSFLKCNVTNIYETLFFDLTY